MNPVLQVNPHTPPVQVAVALAGGTHIVHDGPHWVGMLAATQLPEQE
jgi:hypothetical protein